MFVKVLLCDKRMQRGGNAPSSARERDLQLNAELRPMSTFGGYLLKLKRDQASSALLGRWNKRWFNIESHCLRWYKSISHKQPSGSIDLIQIRALAETRHARLGAADDLPVVEESIAESEFCFSIDSRDRLLILRAGSRNEMQMWLQQLQMLVDRTRGGDGNNMIGWQFNRTQLNSTGGARAIMPATPRTTTNTVNTAGDATGDSPANSLQSGDDSNSQADANSDFLLESSFDGGHDYGLSRPGSRGVVRVSEDARPGLTLSQLQRRKRERKLAQAEQEKEGKSKAELLAEDLDVLEMRSKIEKARNMKLGVGTTDHEIPPPDRGTGDDVNTDLGDDVIVLNPSPPSSPTGAGTGANSNEQRQGGLFRNQVDLGGRLDAYSRSSSIAGRLERPGSRGGGSVMMADPSENQTQTLTIATSNINTNTNTNTNSSASAASTSSGSSLNRGGTHTTIGARLGYSIQHNPSPEISPRVNPGPGIDKYSSNSASGSNHTTAETVAALSKGLGSSDRVRVSYAGVGKGVGDNKTPRETQNNTRSDSNTTVAPTSTTAITTTAKKPPNAGKLTSKDGGGGQPPSKILESLRVVQHQQQQQQQQLLLQQGESWTEARRSLAGAGAGVGAVGREGGLLGVVNTATTTTSGSASASSSSSELDYSDERGGLYSSVSAASAAGRVSSPVPIVSGVDSTVRTFSSVGSD